jgi:hypothetical protein
MYAKLLPNKVMHRSRLRRPGDLGRWAQEISMNKTYSIQFHSNRFDQVSKLPDSINSGNRFYGSDLAEYVKEKLQLIDYVVIDEDWGWLVTGMSNGLVIDYGIGDWHDIDNSFGGKPNNIGKTEANWNIVISAYKKNRFLGIVPYRRQVDCPEIICQKLVQLLKFDGDKIVESGLE